MNVNFTVVSATTIWNINRFERGSMAYITVTGKILTLGVVESMQTSSRYEFIELEDKEKADSFSTNRVLVGENLNLLLVEGLSGKFVFEKSAKLSTLIGIDTGEQQTTILEDSAMENIKGMKALRAMSAIGLLGAALGITQLMTEGWTTGAFLLSLFGTLFTVITGVQPIILERLKGKHYDALQDAGFDLSVVNEKRRAAEK